MNACPVVELLHPWRCDSPQHAFWAAGAVVKSNKVLVTPNIFLVFTKPSICFTNSVLNIDGS